MFLKVLGKNPSGERLKQLQHSPNYIKNGFKNIMPTKLMENVSVISILWKFINKPKNTVPPKPLPSVGTNLKTLPDDKPVIVWFGHSSYLIKLNGKNILVDPVFSGHASPFSFSTKSFAGTDIFKYDDLPQIDLLIISHDHYDHLDYDTINNLKTKIAAICTSPGVASHLIYWGIAREKITEV